MVEIVINGKKIETEPGTMIIEAADAAGIAIPRFCYHKKLSIAANCRMCLVEVAGGRKPMPACATPVTDGMQVFTNSPMALESQKAVMEFLLINHPLDCPICDQGGECELQDIAIGYGSDVSQYTEGKRSVKDTNLGSLIATDMTRCIHCTRCVRFTQEIAGFQELGAVGRGEHTQIGTYIEKSVDSELSGNVIDVCPVGALTSKPFRFKSRTWELKQYASIAPHDCIGSNIYLHTKKNIIYRAIPKENESINEVWLADRDRFSYEAIHSEQRITTPLVKDETGRWQEVEWQIAFDKVCSGLKKVAALGVEEIGALISSSATLEEGYLLQKFMRSFGCHNIDHRLNMLDFSDQEVWELMPTFDLEIADIEQQEYILLVGSNIRKEQPIAAHRVNKAFRNGSKIGVINPIQYDFVFELENEIISKFGQIDYDLAAVAKCLGCDDEAIRPLLIDIKVSALHQGLADELKGDYKSKALFLGLDAISHPNSAKIRALAKAIAKLTDTKIAYFTEGANSSGMWLSGCIPHRESAGSILSQHGKDAHTMFANPLKAYLLFGIEPELDSINPGAAITALNKADFVVNFSAFTSDKMLAYSDVILPISTFTETSGSYVNSQGTWQTFDGIKSPEGEARPGWKVLRVLANQFGFPGFDFMSSAEVKEELKAKLQSMPFHKTNMQIRFVERVKRDISNLIRIAEKPIYAVDALVRRAKALQKTKDADKAKIFINRLEAQKLNLKADSLVTAKQEGQEIQLPLAIDDRIPDGCVLIPRGIDETNGFGCSYAAIELENA